MYNVKVMMVTSICGGLSSIKVWNKTNKQTKRTNDYRLFLTANENFVYSQDKT